MGIGAILVIVGIVVLIISSLWLGLILIILASSAGSAAAAGTDPLPDRRPRASRSGTALTAPLPRAVISLPDRRSSDLAGLVAFRA